MRAMCPNHLPSTCPRQGPTFLALTLSLVASASCAAKIAAAQSAGGGCRWTRSSMLPPHIFARKSSAARKSLGKMRSGPRARTRPRWNRAAPATCTPYASSSRLPPVTSSLGSGSKAAYASAGLGQLRDADAPIASAEACACRAAQSCTEYVTPDPDICHVSDVALLSLRLPDKSSRVPPETAIAIRFAQIATVSFWQVSPRPRARATAHRTVASGLGSRAANRSRTDRGVDGDVRLRPGSLLHCGALSPEVDWVPFRIAKCVNRAP